MQSSEYKSENNNLLYDKSKPFKILSIDGGGIRGIYPAKILSELEYRLASNGKSETNLNKYFDLICGTSTGGIIALGLALGMKASDILNLYKEHKEKIFEKKQPSFLSFFTPSYKTDSLKDLLKNIFAPYSEDNETRLGHAKTRVCIPVFNGYAGRVSVYKTSHHPELMRDYQYPAQDVALSTSAAPFFFKPHSFSYQKKGAEQFDTVTNAIDGGIFANNPSLIGIIEANQTLGVPLEQLKVLSIGTGTKKFKESSKDQGWGSKYWAFEKPRRIIELIFTSQADDINNIIKFLNQGVGTSGEPTFLYKRIQFEFNDNNSITLDETDSKKLTYLEEKALNDFQFNGSDIVKEFCQREITPYEPVHKL